MTRSGSASHQRSSMRGSSSAVDEVDDEVDHHDQAARETKKMPSSRLRSRARATRRRAGPRPGPGEHGLDHHRAAQQRADLHAGQRHHRQQRVAQHVRGATIGSRSAPWRARSRRSPCQHSPASRRASAARRSPGRTAPASRPAARGGGRCRAPCPALVEGTPPAACRWSGSQSSLMEKTTISIEPDPEHRRGVGQQRQQRRSGCPASG